MSNLVRYVKQILIAFDQLLNTLVPFGWADETFSARCYRENDDRIHWLFLNRLIDAIFYCLTFKWGHCKRAYLSEQERMQLPPEYRG